MLTLLFAIWWKPPLRGARKKRKKQPLAEDQTEDRILDALTRIKGFRFAINTADHDSQPGKNFEKNSVKVNWTTKKLK